MLPARTQKSCWLIVLTITICIISFPAYAKYSGGSGTTDDPYQIAKAVDLIALGESSSYEDYDKNFILTTNIDINRNPMVFNKAVIAPNTGDNWGEFQGTPFTGVFDGNGYKISNLTITGKDYLGLFGELGSGAKVRNLGLVNVNINASGDYAGALAGKNDHGTVTQCYSTGTISGKNSVGGMVGSNCYGYIINCYSTCTVNSSSIELAYIGGLLGENSNGTVALCYSSGTVNSSSTNDSVLARTGGLIGFNSYGTVTQCFSTGAVRGNYETGGLVGNDSFGKITKSYSTGSVTTTGTSTSIGGFIGICIHNYVSQCYSTGVVSGNRSAQGFVGQKDFGVITACFWDTQTSGQANSTGGGTGKTTAEMKSRAPYRSAGWDFAGESSDGAWRLCEGTNYPRLVWQIQTGDFVCPDGVSIVEDFDFFMDQWGNTNCSQSNGYCYGTDLNFSGTVDISDYEILLSLWLAENP